MGFNTVAFLLNDYSYEISRSPKTIAWMLAHPPNHFHGDEETIGRHIFNVAESYGEPVPHSQMLKILPPFHSSEHHYYFAGENCIQELKVVGRKKVKGKNQIILEFPEGWG